MNCSGNNPNSSNKKACIDKFIGYFLEESYNGFYNSKKIRPIVQQRPVVTIKLCNWCFSRRFGLSKKSTYRLLRLYESLGWICMNHMTIRLNKKVELVKKDDRNS